MANVGLLEDDASPTNMDPSNIDILQCQRVRWRDWRNCMLTDFLYLTHHRWVVRAVARDITTKIGYGLFQRRFK